MSRRTFVLVHGAWHGGWGWTRVVERLRAKGHAVYAPSLTGLGERAHLLHPDVDLSLHIEDVLGVVHYEDLSDVVLVGHSYGGNVISGVAEKVGGKIRSLVFVDAFIPDDGQSVLDIVQPVVAEAIRAAAARGDKTVPVRDAAAFLVNEKDRAWVDRLANPQPIGTFLEKIKLTGARDQLPRAYVRATGYPNVAFDAAYARAKAEGWRTYEVDCGHDIMINEPDRLTEILIEAAA
ncbi:MAG: alpha/beta hydrolase [Pseudolabrys sp.]|nr:alpha/beta hydrolase [Pseudolabrys sp.]